MSSFRVGSAHFFGTDLIWDLYLEGSVYGLLPADKLDRRSKAQEAELQRR